MTERLIRTFWRHLPVGFRRRLARTGLSLLAPRPGAQPVLPANAPVIVVGFLTSPSGLGQSARLAIRAFAAQGQDVYGVDLSRNFFEIAENVNISFRDGRGMQGPARVLININAPYMKYALQLLGRAFLRDKEVTAYWAWELPRAPESWRAGFACAHKIAAPSRFVAEALQALGSSLPIVVAPHPVALEALPHLPPRTAAISAAAPFTVASSFNVASGFARKNPLALVATFRAAFAGRDDVRLRLLATGVEHFPEGKAQLVSAIGGDSAIELTTDPLDRDAYWRWYGRPDLYASLHRAEGFGLTIAEAMCLGVPALATNWSANAEYMTEANALPVSFKLVPVVDPQQKYIAPNQHWAEPDVAHAATLMRRALDEPDWLARIAAQGRADAHARFARLEI